MNQHRFSFRIGALCLLIAVAMGIFGVRLYQLQVVQAADIDPNQPKTYTYTTKITAARGEIVDRNGNVLVGNRASYNILLVYNVLFSTETPNESLRQLTNLCVQQGLDIIDHLPVTAQKPYEYTKDEYTAVWNNYFKTFLNKREWDSDISAPQLINRLKDRYNIPEDWTEEEARRVIAVRYEMELRRGGLTTLTDYELVNDVDMVSLAAITELGIPGVVVVNSTVREYKTTHAAHILGYVGAMNKEEYEYYKEYDYALDAKVGKTGLEKAYELQLHGTDGVKQVTISADGSVISEEYLVTPVAGNNVEITIDLDLQAISEEELEATILDFRENGVNGTSQGKDAEGGAIVAMEVKTGEVLVCASYPTYDPARIYEDYNELLETEYGPLYNRALQAALPPGSVYKMVTAIATIDNGIAGPGYKIEDKGIYTRFEGYTPRCMLYTTSKGTQTHGWIDVREALAASCNYYFYETGWMTGIDRIDAVAKALGLGEATGVELAENTGHRANPESKQALYEGSDGYWYDGDTIAAAIGQSINRFTTMQLCSYTAALANQGTRYEATFLRRVLSSDYDELVEQNFPTVASSLAISDTAYQAYVEGMRMSTYYYYGTVTAVFRDYDIDVAVKTGTAQHGSGGSDHASLVLFAPADDPQIAIAIYVEKGASGGKLGYIAKSILDAYFSETSSVDLMPGENVIN